MKILQLILLLLIGCTNKYEHLHQSLDDTLAIIDEVYPEPVDSEKLRIGMLQGVIQSTDPNGSYLSETQLKILLETIEGGDLKFGIQVEEHKDGILVKKVFPQSAGQTAGLQAGDLIITFDDQPLKEMKATEFPALIKGKKAYKLLILRNGHHITKEVIPGHFIYPTTELKWFKNIAYLKFGCIGKDSDHEVRDQLITIQKNPKLSGLILDFRDSPGGSFEASLGIASQFLDGDVVIEVQKKEGFSKFASSGPDTLHKLPICVLQNHNTSSAAEIIAVALKTNKRAKIIGEKSSGTATAKLVAKYVDRNDGLIISLAFLNDSQGKRIGKDGIEPDILIKETKVHKASANDTYIAEALRVLSK